MYHIFTPTYQVVGIEADLVSNNSGQSSHENGWVHMPGYTVLSVNAHTWYGWVIW